MDTRSGLAESVFGTRVEALGEMLGALLLVALAPPAGAQTTSRVSVNLSGFAGNFTSDSCSISADGRYVAFESIANGDSSLNSTASLSADGRYVVFWSLADNLVTGDMNGAGDVFLRDLQSGTTERVSVDSSGGEANGTSVWPSITADGRYVVFMSSASNLVSGDTNGAADIFVHDRQTGITELVSVDSNGAQANANCGADSAISADGRYVAFYSAATNLVSGDTNGFSDVFVRDRVAGTTECVSVDATGATGDQDSVGAAISADGRYVAFSSLASNLVSGDTGNHLDVFMRDRQNGTTERVSFRNLSEIQGNHDSFLDSISADGRFVTFSSYATNLVLGDTNGSADVFIRDRSSGATERVSIGAGNVQGDGDALGSSVSADGRTVAFASGATNLLPGDLNSTVDVYVRERDSSHSTLLCEPGSAGVIACPCSNPPSGSGRGCDNRAHTGGAIIGAAGIADLASDSLVFTSSGEPSSATSVLLQGNAPMASGSVYGQGVRCVGGQLKRLYTKSAVGGSVTVPNFGAGDPSVTARSAAKGDLILSGQSRWYLIYYRDPVVSGGCPATSTFNATPTVSILWYP
jgi:Tol biopolymer transport system component